MIDANLERIPSKSIDSLLTMIIIENIHSIRVAIIKYANAGSHIPIFII